jgi:uncharacterized glyoxalase superfamily protein PhnB
LVFGGAFSSVVRFKELPIEGVTIPKEDEDKIMHIPLPIGDDTVLMASDVQAPREKRRRHFLDPKSEQAGRFEL